MCGSRVGTGILLQRRDRRTCEGERHQLPKRGGNKHTGYGGEHRLVATERQAVRDDIQGKWRPAV